jgi:hypothetical protein
MQQRRILRKSNNTIIVNTTGIVDLLNSDNSTFGLTQMKIENSDLNSISESTSIESVDSTNDSCSSDDSDTCEQKMVITKYYYVPRFKKKAIVEIKEYKHYAGETITEFNKFSPFINMLINRRIRFCDLGPSCHIASFVPDLGIENKFSNWAFGKMAIGENSERFRFGNNRLSTHAEMDALQKLDNLIRIKKCKKQKMDLVVIRVNKTGNLCESAPCYHCTKELAKSPVVTINKLYFSRSNGTITCIKFSDWIKNENLHISKGWKWLSCNN